MPFTTNDPTLIGPGYSVDSIILTGLCIIVLLQCDCHVDPRQPRKWSTLPAVKRENDGPDFELAGTRRTIL